MFDEKYLILKTFEKTSEDIVIDFLHNNILVQIHQWLNDSVTRNQIREIEIITHFLSTLPVNKDIVLNKSNSINKTISKLCKQENPKIKEYASTVKNEWKKQLAKAKGNTTTPNTTVTTQSTQITTENTPQKRKSEVKKGDIFGQLIHTSKKHKTEDDKKVISPFAQSPFHNANQSPVNNNNNTSIYQSSSETSNNNNNQETTTPNNTNTTQSTSMEIESNKGSEEATSKPKTSKRHICWAPEDRLVQEKLFMSDEFDAHRMRDENNNTNDNDLRKQDMEMEKKLLIEYIYIILLYY